MEVEQGSVAEGVQQSSEATTPTSLAPEVGTDPLTGLKVRFLPALIITR
jgi:hypothetical protein